MIKLDVMLDQIGLYAGVEYAPEGPGGVRECRYATPVPGMPGLQLFDGKVRQADCCTTIEGVVVGAAARCGHTEWGRAFHRRMMNLDGHRHGPTEALVLAGIAVEVDKDLPPPAWSVAQLWTPKAGHTIMIAAVHHNGPAVGILPFECSKSMGGVIWRGYGPVTAGAIPEDWASSPRVWTWAKLCEIYPERSVCALRMAA